MVEKYIIYLLIFCPAFASLHTAALRKYFREAIVGGYLFILHAVGNFLYSFNRKAC